jgi:5-methylcytosine-specific restriction endonuclease McrA
MSDFERTLDTLSGESRHRAHVLADVCEELGNDRDENAISILQKEYPFEPFKNVGRRYTELQSLGVFARDHFIDRYSGAPLVFPGTLRVLSLRLPKDFPFHSNWKTDECHFAYWELLPTIDHVVPVSRNGFDNESNWVTTSMVRNASKGNFHLHELGWTLRPPERYGDWDGLTSWFLAEVARNPLLLSDGYIRTWHRALKLTP